MDEEGKNKNRKEVKFSLFSFHYISEHHENAKRRTKVNKEIKFSLISWDYSDENERDNKGSSLIQNISKSLTGFLSNFLSELLSSFLTNPVIFLPDLVNLLIAIFFSFLQ